MAPFRGVRYAAGRVSGLAEVTSPPYDVIAHDIEDQLIAADPHNVVRLILPRSAAGHPAEIYAGAARMLRDWQDGRILVPDAVPGLYVYEQAAQDPAGGGRPAGGPAGRSPGVQQRGLIGALRLVPPEAGIVLPHEDVVPGPVSGRRQLMEATQANLEPIFLLYDGSRPGAATRLVEDDATTREPLVEALTKDGVRHRLWAVVELAKSAFCVRPLPGGTRDLTAALDALAQAARYDGVAFLVAGGGEVHLLSEPDPVQAGAAMPPGHSPRWRGLAASVLQELLITRVWGIHDDERSVRIVHHDAAAAIRAADQAPGGTAVICTALSAADVYAIAANGERVPRKSTSFGPKPRTGLVIRTFAHG